MKCLREVDNEDIIREACETTAMNDIVSLGNLRLSLPAFSVDWGAVFFVCKYMKKLKRLEVSFWSEECLLEVSKLLQQRCMEQLTLVLPEFVGPAKAVDADGLCKALVESNCTLKHEHSKLSELNIEKFHVTDESLSTMCEFFKNGRASCLKKFVLHSCGIKSRGVSILCEALDSTLCPELTYLKLSSNSICDESATALCNALVEQKLFKLTRLVLDDCSLTDECIPSLCEPLRDERCNLTVLSLRDNKGVSDVGLRMLCESALTSEHCKLAELHLDVCSLTDQCIPELCEALQDERCKLTVLSLSDNEGISDEGLCLLCELALTKEHCKLGKFWLLRCPLTDKCIPALRNALQDEHCVLNELCLSEKKFTEEGEKSLREIATHKYCQDRGLTVEIW